MLNVWPQGIVDIYTVKFQDGRQVDCCLNHLWKYHIAGGKGKRVVSPTSKLLEIVQRENAKSVGVRKKLPITPLIKPVEFGEKVPLAISPYVLGVILGDGHIKPTGGVTVTSMDDEVFNRITSLGYSLGLKQEKSTSKAWHQSILQIGEAIRSLNLQGTKSQTKFIPEQYKTASIEDRFNLMQGLMDTDGYVCKIGKVYYDTTSKQLAADMTYILHSLGYTVTTTTKIGSYKKDGVKQECSEVYRLYIRGPNSYKLFSLPRKLERCINKDVGNKIVDIVYSCKDYATCIGISGKEKLFITTDFIVTHNSFTCLTKNLDGIKDKNFRCTIFRRTYPELKRQGGLIDESKDIYTQFKGEYKSQAMIWKFPSGATIAFSAIATDDDLGSWQGSQLTRALIDEAADKWTEKQFLFLLSRLRSAHSKIHPQLIASCNPDLNSFLKRWVEYSLDPATGVPVEGTEHRIRWFVTLDNQVFWADSPEECFELHGKPRGMKYAHGMTESEVESYPKDKLSELFMPKSFRFIPTGVFDNPYLLPPKNNSYLANLLSQPHVNQLKFLHGSWTAKEASSGYFKRDWVERVDEIPSGIVSRIRAWDFAATEASPTSNNNPDWTVGVKMSKDKYGIYYIEDVIRFRARTDTVLRTVVETAFADGIDECDVCIPVDPGSSGKIAAQYYQRKLAEEGVCVRLKTMSGHSSKLTRFKPLCALAESGALRIVGNPEWEEAFFTELENFEDNNRKQKDDQVDAASDAFVMLARDVVIPQMSLGSMTLASPIPTI